MFSSSFPFHFTQLLKTRTFQFVLWQPVARDWITRDSVPTTSRAFGKENCVHLESPHWHVQRHACEAREFCHPEANLCARRDWLINGNEHNRKPLQRRAVIFGVENSTHCRHTQMPPLQHLNLWWCVALKCICDSLKTNQQTDPRRTRRSTTSPCTRRALPEWTHSSRMFHHKQATLNHHHHQINEQIHNNKENKAHLFSN